MSETQPCSIISGTVPCINLWSWVLMHFFLVGYIVQFSFLGQFQGSVSLLRSGNASASYTKHHWTMCYRKIWNPQGKIFKNWCWWLCMCGVNRRQNKEFLFCSDNQISLKNVFVLFSRNLFFFFMRWSDFFFKWGFQKDLNCITANAGVYWVRHLQQQ